MSKRKTITVTGQGTNGGRSMGMWQRTISHASRTQQPTPTVRSILQMSFQHGRVRRWLYRLTIPGSESPRPVRPSSYPGERESLYRPGR